MAEEIIKNFDKREPQVLLEISIIEITDQDTNSANWNHILTKSRTGGDLSFVGSTFQIQDVRRLVKKGGRFHWYDSGPVEAGGTDPAFLQTVMDKTKARLLANPRIIRPIMLNQAILTATLNRKPQTSVW